MQALFGIMAAAAALLWLFKRARRARSEPADSGEKEPSFALRARGGDLIEAVDDPRIAAAAILCAVTRLEGDLGAPHWRRIRIECRTAFRCDQRVSDDIALGGRWLSEQFDDQHEFARVLTRKLHALAPREAHEDLLRMVTRLTSANGAPPTPRQRRVIDQLRRDLDLV